MNSHPFQLRKVAIAGLAGFLALVVIVRISNPTEPSPSHSNDRFSHAQELSLEAQTESGQENKVAIVSKGAEDADPRSHSLLDSQPVSTMPGVVLPSEIVTMPPARVSELTSPSPSATGVSIPPTPSGLQLTGGLMPNLPAAESQPPAAASIIPPPPPVVVAPPPPPLRPVSMQTANLPPPPSGIAVPPPVNANEKLDGQSLEDLVANLNALKAKRAELDQHEKELTSLIREKITERKRAVQQLERDLEKMGVGVDQVWQKVN